MKPNGSSGREAKNCYYSISSNWNTLAACFKLSFFRFFNIDELARILDNELSATINMEYN